MSKNKKPNYTVTAQGSLGLLALGDLGIQLWRDAIKENRENKKVNSKDKNEQK
jgi:hypothetical protein